jgi:CTP:molybdopterin cytidylyltransferase MocA
MHAYKPLLTLGSTPMIEVVIGLFQDCGIRDVVVVTGHNHDRLAPVVRRAGAGVVFNPNFETGMLGSIQKGAGQIASDSRGFFLLPVDIPAIRVFTIQTLISAFDTFGQSIIIPEFDHTPGHPPLIPAGLIPDILSMGPDENLGSLLLAQKDHMVRCPVHDHGILLDADTQEDYAFLNLRFHHMDIPDTAECHALIREFLPGEIQIQSHLLRVAETAVTLALALENPGIHPNGPAGTKRLDLDLIRAAALLHDIQRKEKDHARAGSRLLTALGFPRVAEIVGTHMNIVPKDPITEAEIVYLADKLCRGDQLELDYSPRFFDQIRLNPEAETDISRRYQAAQKIQASIEAGAGRPLAGIF